MAVFGVVGEVQTSVLVLAKWFEMSDAECNGVDSDENDDEGYGFIW